MPFEKCGYRLRTFEMKSDKRNYTDIHYSHWFKNRSIRLHEKLLQMG